MDLSPQCHRATYAQGEGFFWVTFYVPAFDGRQEGRFVEFLKGTGVGGNMVLIVCGIVTSNAHMVFGEYQACGKAKYLNLKFRLLGNWYHELV